MLEKSLIEQERLALLANDIRVLVSQLNDAVRKGPKSALDNCLRSRRFWT